MKTILTALIAGILFGAGLAVSGMMNPQKVIGFLDMTGNWDPSLAFVMGGAFVVALVGFRVAAGKAAPMFDSQFHLPDVTKVDRKLVLGAVLFGLGWGISGLCPGPALAALVTGSQDILVFVAALLVGVLGYRFIT